MDTHVADNTLVSPLSSRRPDMVLPGEDDGETTVTMSPASGAPTHPPAPVRKSRRGALLAGGAVGAVVLATAGVLLISPFNAFLPIGVQDAVVTARQGAENTVRGAAQAVGLVAPAARIAAAPPPVPVPAPVRETPPRTTHEAQVKEILAYGQQPGTSAPSRSGSTADPSAPEQASLAQRRPVESTPLARRIGDAPRAAEAAAGEPKPVAPPLAPDGSAAQAAAAPPTLVASAAPAAPAVAPAPPAVSVRNPSAPAAAATAPIPPLVVLPVAAPSSPTATPSDAVATAANLRPTPMTTPQQVEVLGLVTEMAVIQRNREARDRQMQADLAAMKEQLENTVADLSRRLALAEARGAMNAAMGAASQAPPVQVNAPPPATPVAVRSPAPAAPVAADTVRRRYRVQAASPGLAMLSEVDRTGEAGSQLQVAVGDDVPGYGKITAIAQQGSSWVVRAERGTIQ